MRCTRDCDGRGQEQVSLGEAVRNEVERSEGWCVTHKIWILWEKVVCPSFVAPLRGEKIDKGTNGIEETLGDGRRKASRAEFISHSLLKEMGVRTTGNRDC
jgi:hypothetical protein